MTATLFILAEGLDGTGKTHITNELLHHYPNAWKTRQPFCENIRDEVSSLTDETDRLMCFCHDRLRHNADIVSHLETQDVICDRYWPSNAAYQGRKIGYNEVLQFQPSNNIKPDILLYLSAPLDVINSRLEKRGEDRMDRRTYDHLIQGYEWAIRRIDSTRQKIPRHEAYKCRVVRLNGAGDMEENVKLAVKHIEEVRRMISV